MELTVTKLAESIQDIAEALVHRRQRLQLDLLKVLGTLVLQVTISLADAANHGGRLKAEIGHILWVVGLQRRVDVFDRVNACLDAYENRHEGSHKGGGLSTHPKY